MKDMNIPKLTSTDLPLFNGIMSDLFPGVETSTVDYSKVSSCATVLCLVLDWSQAWQAGWFERRNEEEEEDGGAVDSLYLVRRNCGPVL